MVDATQDGTSWITLREAHEATGASLPAMRRWYREGLINSVVVPGAHGAQRLVDLDEVTARAASSPGIARRASRGRATPEEVTAALIEQVASMSMELADLRDRVADLEARTS